MLKSRFDITSVQTCYCQKMAALNHLQDDGIKYIPLNFDCGMPHGHQNFEKKILILSNT